MAPQPLKNAYPKAKSVVIGPNCIDSRPELAILVAKCISIWSLMEADLAFCLGSMLGGNAKPAFAMFAALTSSAAQYAAIDAAAEATLDKRRLAVFRAVLKEVRKTAKSRHRLAHWLWAVCPDAPDSLCLIDPRARMADFIHLHELQNDSSRSDERIDFIFNKFLLQHVFVYNKKTLEEILSEMGRLFYLTMRLATAVTLDNPSSDRAVSLLETDPAIAATLAKAGRFERED